MKQNQSRTQVKGHMFKRTPAYLSYSQDARVKRHKLSYQSLANGTTPSEVIANKKSSIHIRENRNNIEAIAQLTFSSSFQTEQPKHSERVTEVSASSQKNFC